MNTEFMFNVSMFRKNISILKHQAQHRSVNVANPQACKVVLLRTIRRKGIGTSVLNLYGPFGMSSKMQSLYVCARKNVACECGQVAAQLTCVTKHCRHFRLEYTDRKTVARQSTNWGHRIQVPDFSINAIKWKYMDRIIRESIEIELRPFDMADGLYV